MVESDTNIFKNLPDKLLSGTSEVDKSSVLDNDLIGFYFSAHWCPPCRGFTPVLSEAYKEWKKDGKKIEIVFISSDRDEDSFKEYFASMPWVAIPKSKTDNINALKVAFEVKGIPFFVVVDKTGKTVDAGGRGTVTSNPVGAVDVWLKK